MHEEMAALKQFEESTDLSALSTQAAEFFDDLGDGAQPGALPPTDPPADGDGGGGAPAAAAAPATPLAEGGRNGVAGLGSALAVGGAGELGEAAVRGGWSHRALSKLQRFHQLKDEASIR